MLELVNHLEVKEIRSQYCDSLALFTIEYLNLLDLSRFGTAIETCFISIRAAFSLTILLFLIILTLYLKNQIFLLLSVATAGE